MHIRKTQSKFEMSGVTVSLSEELLQIISQLNQYADHETSSLDALAEAAERIGKSWSGSTMGYHSRVYYANFQPPPRGTSFDPTFGLDPDVPPEKSFGWQEYDRDSVIRAIEEGTNLSTELLSNRSEKATEVFEAVKLSVRSLIYANYQERDELLQELLGKIEVLEILFNNSSVEAHITQAEVETNDQRAIEEGHKVPPHIEILELALGAKGCFDTCKALRKQILELTDHIKNLENSAVKMESVGTHVFIGHGRSPIWRELKDFINERLELPYDEFNRVPTPGIDTRERLKEMLDQACMAFLVMTAEDEQTDGTLHARENVIHEAGLFQSRLGFKRAIILLEKGCQEFSNIHGLGQIRFPKGNIKAAFEEIRQVLEREGII